MTDDEINHRQSPVGSRSSVTDWSQCPVHYISLFHQIIKRQSPKQKSSFSSWSPPHLALGLPSIIVHHICRMSYSTAHDSIKAQLSFWLFHEAPPPPQPSPLLLSTPVHLVSTTHLPWDTGRAVTVWWTCSHLTTCLSPSLLLLESFPFHGELRTEYTVMDKTNLYPPQKLAKGQLWHCSVRSYKGAASTGRQSPPKQGLDHTSSKKWRVTRYREKKKMEKGFSR